MAGDRRTGRRPDGARPRAARAGPSYGAAPAAQPRRSPSSSPGWSCSSIGENPLEALQLLVDGAFGYGEAIGYTLYYATNFIFTGLAVAVAFHAGLFNIGGEGQAYLGGLGVALVGLAAGACPARVALPLGVLAAAAFGAVWGFIPGWLQAKRGSHVVITTIMFNFVAAALMTYLLVNVLIEPGSADPRERRLPADRLAALPAARRSRPLGVDLGARAAEPLASCSRSSAASLVWLYVWKTPARLRAAGRRPQRGGRGLRRHLARPADHPRHDDLGRARRPDGDERAHGRPAPPDRSTSPAATASSASRWR